MKMACTQTSIMGWFTFLYLSVNKTVHFLLILVGICICRILLGKNLVCHIHYGILCLDKTSLNVGFTKGNEALCELVLQ